METGVVSKITEFFGVEKKDAKQYAPLTLAYIGDAVYEMVVRTILVEQNDTQVNKLHKKASSLVKAGAQCELFHKIEADLSEEEMSVFKRGRNAKSHTVAKNADVGDYRIATGVEALIGYLYLSERYDRILELMKGLL